jgi:hypothetical protein
VVRPKVEKFRKVFADRINWFVSFN